MARFVSRRGFVGTGVVAAAGAALSGTFLQGKAEAQRKPPIEPTLVKAFVGKAHSDLDRVKELLAEAPTIVNAAWDWGNGDFETALGAASHMGRRDIADFLLQNKARKDVFCAAMKGEVDIIRASLAVDPSVAMLPGPHRISFLFHAALGGNVDIAKMLVEAGAHDGTALHAAVWYGHLAMTRWLLDNDTKDINNIRMKRTPLDLADQEGHAEIAALLETRGGVRKKVN